VNHAGRLRRLGEALGGHGVDALLVSNLTNIRYLTGFTGSNALLVVRPDDAIFLTDFRYLERVAPLREFLEVRQVNQEILRVAGEQVAAALPPGGRAGFEAAHLTVAQHRLLAAALPGTELVPTNGAVEQLRMIKDEREQEAIRRAAALLEPVYATLAEEGLAGRTEIEVAWRIQELFHEAGAQGGAFDSIVASSEAGALPHAEPRDTVIAGNTLVTIDLGCRLDGYLSDCTRTFATGPLPAPLDEIYALCLEAQLAGLAAVKPGAGGAEVDAVVRDLITEAGHGAHFQHGTGHGVGLDIHEAPRLATTSSATLEVGMVVTVEPGIYLPGVGGVRIEDLVIVTADGAERLTGYPKELVTSG
jgi:Xaa-Pro aminopeptidase